MMGSFSEYLESLKDTPEYAYAKIENEITDAIFRQMQERGVSEEELAAMAYLPKERMSDILTGEMPLVGYALACIAYALDCDVRIELVPKESCSANAQNTLEDGDSNAPNTLEKRCNALEQEAEE